MRLTRESGRRNRGISFSPHVTTEAPRRMRAPPASVNASSGSRNIGNETPAIAIALHDPTYEKMRSNIGEVSARSAPVLAIGTEGDKDLPKFVDDVIWIPEIPWIFSPVPVSLALQLFAYEVARLRGCPIDKPRNLAKSVTVE